MTGVMPMPALPPGALTSVGSVAGLTSILLPPPPIALLAAPVMAAERYGVADLLLRRRCPPRQPFYSFADLRGASWAYNEPGSQSGYHVTRYHLARLGETGGYFGRVVGSGGHLRSLGLFLACAADASAIDSTVLEWAMALDKTLAPRLRVIATLGPSPSPPLVVAGQRGLALREELRAALLALPDAPTGQPTGSPGCQPVAALPDTATAEGQTLLCSAGWLVLPRLKTATIHPIRIMAQVAQAAPDFV